MDRPRLLIIGARGFLGMHTAEAAAAAGKFEIILANRTDFGEPASVTLDLADNASIRTAFEKSRPDAVLLLGALSDIDRCEAMPELAFAINAHGAEYVANCCARSGARLLFTSTAAVFDGTRHGYREEDMPAPISVYGKTKAWAEQAVQGLVPSAAIIRFALVLGFARRLGTNAMLDSTVEKWKQGNAVSFPTREYRNPVDAGTLARIIIAAIGGSKLIGVYHVGALDSVSRYDLALRLADRLGYSPNLVAARETPLPGRAPRGEDHFLLTEKIRSILQIDLGSTNEVIERCLV
jgi:dTDP-4-dehydrorhamnose reductase